MRQYVHPSHILQELEMPSYFEKLIPYKRKKVLVVQNPGEHISTGQSPMVVVVPGFVVDYQRRYRDQTVSSVRPVPPKDRKELTDVIGKAIRRAGFRGPINFSE